MERVSKESKAWAADPSNRRCDALGSWYCPGAYPPQLTALLAHARPSLLVEGAAGGLSDDDREERDRYHRLYRDRLAAQELTKPRPNGPDLPAGSYLGSCRGCSYVQRPTRQQLRCTHCKGAGPATPSELDVRKCGGQPVDNIQGELQCKPKPNAKDIPRGGYARSCEGCRLEGGAFLRCSHCGTADGRRVKAAYDLARCPPPGSLDNQDGKIVCTGLPHAEGIPSGGFRTSCLGCRLGGDQLICTSCRRADGSEVESSLALSSCYLSPSHGVDNSDGSLVCVKPKPPPT